LRYWAKKPWIDQKTVNDLIWTGQDLGVLRTQVIPARLRKSTLSAWGGELIWLSGTGRLHRKKGEGWEELGKGLEKAVTGQGMVLGLHRAIAGVRFRSLTGTGWQFQTLPGIPDKAQPASGFAILALVERKLLRFDPSNKEFRPVCEFHVSDFALLGSGKEEVLFALEADSGKIQVLDRNGEWREVSALPARRIAGSGSALYAEFGTGIFRHSSKWIKVAESGSEMLPSRTACYFAGAKKLVRYDEKTGKQSELPPLKSTVLSMCVDPVTGILHALDESGSIWSFSDKAWEKTTSIPEKAGTK
jgi:hypothetical protein